MSEGILADDKCGNGQFILTGNAWQQIPLLIWKLLIKYFHDLHNGQLTCHLHPRHVDTSLPGDIDIVEIRTSNEIDVNIRVPEALEHILESISRRVKLRRRVVGGI